MYNDIYSVPKQEKKVKLNTTLGNCSTTMSMIFVLIFLRN